MLVAVFASVVICLATFYAWVWWNQNKKIIRLMRKLPGPPAYPIVGNIKEILVPPQDRIAVFQRLIRTYGSLFRLYFGYSPYVHFSKAKHIEKVLGSLTHIKKSYGYRLLEPWLGTGLLTSSGEKWHLRRKIITPTFHFRILEDFLPVFIEKSNELLEKIKPFVGKDEVDLYPFITHCSLDIVCETAMGINIKDQSNLRFEYVASVYKIHEFLVHRRTKPWLHPSYIFYNTSMGKQFQKTIHNLNSFTKQVIAEKRTQFNTSEYGYIEGDLHNENVLYEFSGDDIGRKRRYIFLDLLLASSHNLSDNDILEEVNTFMFEGHDTSTASMSWCLYLLGLHPFHQDKVAEEIKEMYNSLKGTPTIQDFSQLKYFERVIKEALRLYPSVAYIGRQLAEDIEIDGLIIPAGIHCVLNIYDLHRDPEYFPDPEVFNPDNFLPENIKNRHPYAYVPFSAGPRNCIGQKFALLEEKVVLATILSKYRVETIRANVTPLPELILRPESGLRVKLYQR